MTANFDCAPMPSRSRLAHGRSLEDPTIRRSDDPTIRRSDDPTYLEATAPVKVPSGNFRNAHRASPDAQGIAGGNVATATSLTGILTGFLTPPCCLRRDPEPRRTCSGDSRDLAWSFPAKCWPKRRGPSRPRETHPVAGCRRATRTRSTHGRAAVADGATVRGRRTRADRERQTLNAARFPWDSTPLRASGRGKMRRGQHAPPRKGNPGAQEGRAPAGDVQIAGLRVWILSPPTDTLL